MNPFISVILLLCMTSLSAQAGQVVDKVVAKVDDQVITESDIREVLRLEQSGFMPPSGKNGPANRSEILAHLVTEKIFASELDIHKISVADTDVDDAINSIVTSHQSTLDKLKAALAMGNVPFDKFRERIRNDLRKRLFVQQIIIPRLRLVDAELEDYYRKHINLFQGFQKIRFQQILLTPESVPAGTTLMEFAGKLLVQLRKGTSFTETAKKYSRGPDAAKGGDGGFVDTANLRPDLVSTLLALPQGAVSDPMPVSSDQIFIFKVLEKKNPGPRPFVQIKDLVRQAYMNEKIGAEMEKYLAQARDRHFVEIKK